MSEYHSMGIVERKLGEIHTEILIKDEEKKKVTFRVLHWRAKNGKIRSF